VLGTTGLDDIRQTLLRSPRKPLRKLSLQSGLSCGSVHKATKILKLHPYRVHVMHELKELDKEKRLYSLIKQRFKFFLYKFTSLILIFI
jgi:hypothetical protein